MRQRRETLFFIDVMEQKKKSYGWMSEVLPPRARACGWTKKTEGIEMAKKMDHRQTALDIVRLVGGPENVQARGTA